MTDLVLEEEYLAEGDDGWETTDLGYRPRDPQKNIHQAVKNHRFNVVVAHRRMGKTVSAVCNH
jgi:hypothetical protein